MGRLKEALGVLFGRKADGGFQRMTQYEYVNGQIVTTSDRKENYIKDGYTLNDAVYAACHLIVEKVRVAPWSVYKIVDETALKQYNSIIRNKNISGEQFKKAVALRRKALEPFDRDVRLNELLDWPNKEQTFSDLVADSSLMKLLTGDRFIYADRLSAGANAGKPMSLEIMPSQDISIKVSGPTWPMQKVGYKLDTYGLIDLSVDDVLHDKYFNPSFSTLGSHFYGQSPLKAALMTLDQSNAENLRAVASYQNGGPKSVIFVNDNRLDGATAGAQAKQVKEILTGKEYSGSANANKLASSAYNMGVINLGLSPTDLQLLESQKFSWRRIFAIFGVPAQLGADDSTTTMNNVEQAEKALTSRCALPQLNTFRDSFNRMLSQSWGYNGQNIYVDYDVNVYTELHEDLSKKWSWVKDLPVPNGYKLDMMGLDHPEGEDDWMDQILVPSNYSTAEDYAANQTDRDLASGNGQVPPDPSGTQV